MPPSKLWPHFWEIARSIPGDANRGQLASVSLSEYDGPYILSISLWLHTALAFVSGWKQNLL